MEHLMSHTFVTDRSDTDPIQGKWGFKWIPPGRFCLGRISLTNFAIDAKIKIFRVSLDLTKLN